MRRISILTLLADLVWIPVALVIAYWTRRMLGSSSPTDPLEHYVYILLVAALIWVALQSRITIEGSRASAHLPAMLSQVTVSSGFLVVTMLATAFMTRELLSREVMLVNGLLLFVGFTCIRLAARGAIKMRARHGGARGAVILGDGQVARELESKVRRHPELMLRVLGLLSPLNSGMQGLDGNPYSTINESLSSVEVIDLLKSERVSEVLVAQPQMPVAELHRVIAQCRKAGMQVRVVPNFYELYLSRTHLVELEGVPLVALLESNLSSAALAIKRILDVMIGFPLLCLGMPIILVAAGYLKIRRRTVFRSEPRCGKSGEVFAMYRLGIERSDSTLNVIERLIANASITELPQLINVLKGQMSMVGPRPESKERVKSYSEWQRQRLNVKPGVTGLAQVYGLRECDSSDAKSYYDLEYILNWSAGGDVSLMLQTVWTLFLRVWGLGGSQAPSMPARPVMHGQAALVIKQPTLVPQVNRDSRSMAHADSA